MSVEIISTEDELSKQSEKTEESKEKDPTGWTLINGMWVMQSSLQQNKPEYSQNPVKVNPGKVNRRMKRSFDNTTQQSSRPPAPKQKAYTELELYIYKKIQVETEKMIDAILNIILRCIRTNLAYFYQISKEDKEILLLDANLEMKDIFDYRLIYIKLEKQKQHCEEDIKRNFQQSGLADLEKHYERIKNINQVQRVAIEMNDESKQYTSIKKCTISTIMEMKTILYTLLKFNNKFPICEDTAIFLGIRKNILQLQPSERRAIHIVNEANIPDIFKFLKNDDLGFQYTIFNFETLSIQELEKKLNHLKLVTSKLEEDQNKLPQEILMSCAETVEVVDIAIPTVEPDLPWWISQEFNPDVVKHELERLRQNAKEAVKVDKEMLTERIVKYFHLNLRRDEETIIQNLDKISICQTYMEIFEGMVLLSEDIAMKEFEAIKLSNSDIENKIKFLHKHKGHREKVKSQKEKKTETRQVSAKQLFSHDKYEVAKQMMVEELQRLRKIVVFALHKALKKSMPFQPSSDEQHYLGMENYTFQSKNDYQDAVKHLDHMRDRIISHARNMFGECTPDELIDHYTRIRVHNGDVFNENQETDTLEMVEYTATLQTVANEIIKLKRGLLIVLSHNPNYSVKRDTTDLLGIWKGLDPRTGSAKKDFYKEMLEFLANDDPGTKFVEFQQRYPNQEQLELKTDEIKIAYAKVFHELLNVPDDVKSSLVQNHRDILTRPSLKKQGDFRHSISRERESDSYNKDRMRDSQIDKSSLPDLKREMEASRAAEKFNQFPNNLDTRWQGSKSNLPDLKTEIEASRTAESFNDISNNYSLGWQELVNTYMIQKGLSDGAIVGQDGGIWACSNGFHIQKADIDEVSNLFHQFSTVSSNPLGFNFGGQLYSFASRTESVVVGKHRSMGLILRKTQITILIGAFRPYGSLQQNTSENIIKALADHLHQSGY